MTEIYKILVYQVPERQVMLHKESSIKANGKIEHPRHGFVYLTNHRVGKMCNFIDIVVHLLHISCIVKLFLWYM